MAKGNDGNLLQHGLDTAIAAHLSRQSRTGRVHIALTHGMAPFETCGILPDGQARSQLSHALEAARLPAGPDDLDVIAAYRRTGASLERYPNSGELLAAIAGRKRLSGAITEVDAEKSAALRNAWSESAVRTVNSSWRDELEGGAALACPPSLASPWLFSMDPMTFREDGSANDAYLYGADASRLSQTLRAFADSGQPGMATIFVYSVNPNVAPSFFAFVRIVAERSGLTESYFWAVHQGARRNIAAVLRSGVIMPELRLPEFIKSGT